MIHQTLSEPAHTAPSHSLLPQLRVLESQSAQLTRLQAALVPQPAALLRELDLVQSAFAGLVDLLGQARRLAA